MGARPLPIDWTIGSLRLLRTLNLGGATLHHMAHRMGASQKQCDLALWALMGRSPEDASLYLRGHR